ncbi:MAG: hypothetical protein AAFR52_09890 [Pseudomonadota bacterium]
MPIHQAARAGPPLDAERDQPVLGRCERGRQAADQGDGIGAALEEDGREARGGAEPDGPGGGGEAADELGELARLDRLGRACAPPVPDGEAEADAARRHRADQPQQHDRDEQLEEREAAVD